MPKKSPPPTPIRTPLLVAAVAALANAGWSAFLWQQLLVARSGAEPFCALGGGGCATLWDGPFASGVQTLTGVPVAGWGVVWSLAAAALAFLAWRGEGSGRNPEPAWSGVVLAALAGVASAAGLILASAAEGAFCSNCAITYVLVLVYAAAAGAGWLARKPREWVRGAGLGLAAGVALFVVLLVPGSRTPAGADPTGRDALAAARAAGNSNDAQLERLVANLSAKDRQTLSNARASYLTSRSVRSREPRALMGSADAPIRMTTFTDSGCSHCATFHTALDDLLETLPPDRVAIDQRVFPLDGSCNPVVKRGGAPELCLAAQVRVCLEADPKAFELAGWLHSDASPLAPDTIYAVAGRLVPQSEVAACVTTPETAAKIREDVEYGMEAGITGTPFVLVNGRPAPAYLPFLYALILAEGNAEHPALAGLPAPDFSSDPHAGHNH